MADNEGKEGVEVVRDERMIAALKRERADYESLGLEDKVAAVDEELKKAGHAPEKPAEPQAPAGRTARPRTSTADQTDPPAKPAASGEPKAPGKA
jgi:hypothetical protein